MTHEELFEHWKARLGLSDWCIAFYDNCSPDDMSSPELAGDTIWSECNKCAIIRIIDEKYYGNRVKPFRFEKTLIHELLHLKFCLLGESGNSLQDRYVHQLIDDLARAFVKEKKGE